MFKETTKRAQEIHSHTEIKFEVYADNRIKKRNN